MATVKKQAVDNFIGSMDKELPMWMHLINAENDGKLYKWNRATINAIKMAIFDAYDVCAIEIIRY